MNKVKCVTYRAAGFIGVTLLYLAFLLGIAGAYQPSNSVYATTADRLIEKTFDVRPGGLLKLETQRGRVSIEGWNRDEVSLKIKIKGHRREVEDVEFYINSTLDEVNIRAEMPGSRSFNIFDRGRQVNLEYTIMVPFEYNTKIKTSGGGITLSKLEGSIEAKTSGGGIKADRLTGRIDIATSGGGLDTELMRGDIKLRTSGGGIKVAGAIGDLEVRTSGGPIRLSNIDAKVNARTSGGGITLSAVGENQGITLITSGGGITVNLPEDIRGNLSAKTSGGNVSTNFPVLVDGVISKRAIEGKINGGGPEIVLKTSGGGIRINKY